MTNRKPTKGSFGTFLSHLKKIETHVPSLLCIHGTSDCLIEIAVDTLRRAASRDQKPCLTLEGAQLSEERLETLWHQQSLFDLSTAHFIRRAEQAKTLVPYLKRTKEIPVSGHSLALIWRSNQLNPSLTQELGRLNGVLIPCLDPFPGEMIDVVAKLADLAQVRLDRSAISLLLEMNGSNLTKHQHDIRQMSLIWNEGPKILTASDIAPMLGLLRQDDAFQLDKLLVTKEWAKAHALVDSLIRRGESALAIVAIIANHCRSAIKVRDALARGCPSHQVAQATGLMPFLAKMHLSALTASRGKDAEPSRHVRGLRACQKADMDLKSTRVPDALVIGTILRDLEA